MSRQKPEQWVPHDTGEMDCLDGIDNRYEVRALTLDGNWRIIAYCFRETEMDLIAAAPETAAERDRLREQNAAMLEALKAVEFLDLRPGENSVDRFERIAAQFHRETGLLAPGKDAPATAPDMVADRPTYNAWVDARFDLARAAIAAADPKADPS